jgi:hypothetical protein
MGLFVSFTFYIHGYFAFFRFYENNFLFDVKRLSFQAHSTAPQGGFSCPLGNSPSGNLPIALVLSLILSTPKYRFFAFLGKK